MKSLIWLVLSGCTEYGMSSDPGPGCDSCLEITEILQRITVLEAATSSPDITVTRLDVGSIQCPQGGIQIHVGVQTENVCNGTNGLNGTGGLDGLDGVDGVDGVDGLDGVDGVDGKPETTPAVVVSSYTVDCNRQTFMYEEFNVEYTARYAAGTLYGFEGIWSHCPLVMGVEAGNMPHVTVAQVREVEPDTVCEASYCPNTSADWRWHNSYSGGYVVWGGHDDMRLAPGMQLRFDEVREVIYTASDYRNVWSGRGEGPLLYEVTVIGDRAYTAPEGWL